MDPAWGLKLPWEYQGAWQPSRASHRLPWEKGPTQASEQSWAGTQAPQQMGLGEREGAGRTVGQSRALCASSVEESTGTLLVQAGKDKPTQEPPSALAPAAGTQAGPASSVRLQSHRLSILTASELRVAAPLCKVSTFPVLPTTWGHCRAWEQPVQPELDTRDLTIFPQVWRDPVSQPRTTGPGLCQV